MPKMKFVSKNISPDRLKVIDQANEIVEEYAEQGFGLTLRQLYYQFVARDLMKNTFRNYKRLGDIISDGRLAGLIDWNAIDDRLREMHGHAHWSSPGGIVEACAQQFRYDLWSDQPYHVEVWVEKDALSGIVAQAAGALDVGYLVCRGFASQTALWEAGQRLRNKAANGKKPVVLHLGDHDPSGMDMTRDNRDRTSMFARDAVRFERIALNMDQIEQYEPPPNAAKESDSRAAGYIAEYGESSWELDALDPKVLADIIKKNIDRFRDKKLFAARLAEQDEAREQLTTVARRWERCCELINDEPEADEE